MNFGLSIYILILRLTKLKLSLAGRTMTSNTIFTHIYVQVTDYLYLTVITFIFEQLQ